MPFIYKRVDEILQDRENQQIFRKLRLVDNGTDFYSNDYLGLARNLDFHHSILTALNADPSLLAGSTGARLISGNSMHLTHTEEYIAQKHQVESCLLFNSGFMANMALLSCIAQRGDTILLDEYVHRSIRDGARLSLASCYKFKHNDLDSLKQLLVKSKGSIFIVIESLYSMEGDFAPLAEICELADKYNASLIVDDAHAFGVYGLGLVSKLKLQAYVFATVVTYGKGAGVAGASILGSRLLVSYLINYAAGFIYSTSVNSLTAISIRKSYEYLENNPNLSDSLQQNILAFRQSGIKLSSASQSPIQVVSCPGSGRAKDVQHALEREHLLTYGVVSPTVPKGKERIRISLHSFNTAHEIQLLTHTLHTYLSR